MYWLTCGYALRAARALGWLLLVLAIFATAFKLYGFVSLENPVGSLSCADTVVEKPDVASKVPWPPGIGDVWKAVQSRDSWTYTIGTATAIISGPEACLTDEGRMLRVVLRTVGPLLIGLVIVSLRSRIKR